MSIITDQRTITEADNIRKAEILDHRVAMLEAKINCYIKFGISFKKMTKVQNQKTAFEIARAAIPV